jgi:hypothetical protein
MAPCWKGRWERERERERLALLGLSLLFNSFPVLILHLVMQKWPTASPYFTSLRASSFCSLLTAINLFRPTCIRLLLSVAIKALSLQLLTAKVVRIQSYGSTYGTKGERSSTGTRFGYLSVITQPIPYSHQSLSSVSGTIGPYAVTWQRDAVPVFHPTNN